MRLTKHGELRLRKRLGLSRKASDRQAKRAYEQGQRKEDFKGEIWGYLTSEGRLGQTAVVYARSVYIFEGDRLITVFPLQRRYWKYVK